MNKEVTDFFREVENGRVVEIDADTSLELDDSKNLFIYCRPGTESSILRKILKSKNHVTKIFIDKDAVLHLGSIQNLGNVEGNISMSVKIMKGGKLYFGDCNSGAKILESKSVIELNDDAYLEKHVCFVCNSNQEYNFDVKVVHKGKNGKSKLINRGLVSGNAKAKCIGLIDIGKNASGCDGTQDNSGLILNDGVQLEFLPYLEINNEDVKCSHGAKITHIDEDQLFYFQSRGVSKKVAKKMIVDGFIIGHCSNMCGLRDELKKIVLNKVLI
ncbi:SufD family Fe-S cluster assembly protein [Nanoarchaeota archaeon]